MGGGKKAVCEGAVLTCNKGVPPFNLKFSVTTPTNVTIENKKVGTEMDFMNNIQPGPTMCTSTTNPNVIAAQGAPQPCKPLTMMPWSPTSKGVTYGPAGFAALNNKMKCNCIWGGGTVKVAGLPMPTITGQKSVTID